MTTQVSVVMAAYNAEAFLAEAIASVLDERYDAMQLIVLDDGSTDRTPDIVRSFASPDITYRRQENRGVAAATNAGLLLATGPIVSFLNADDLWCAGRLALQLALLAEHPEADVVLGHQRRTWRPEGETEWKFLEPELALHLQSCLFRREVFDRVGAFDESFRYCYDWDWFFRARELGVPFFTHPEVTNIYRRHAGNLSLEEDANNREATLVVRRSLARRRAGGRGGSLASVRLDDQPPPERGGEARVQE